MTRSRTEKARHYQKRYGKAHREKAREYKREWQRAHPEARARWVLQHPGKVREYRRRHYQKHKAKIAEYRSQRRTQTREYQRAYRATHRREVNAHKLAWRRANPQRLREHARMWSARQRAIKRQAAGCHTEAQWLSRVEYFGWRCVYCGRVLKPENAGGRRVEPDTLTKDHTIPLSKRGSDWASNLRPACKSCNSSKHTSLASRTFTLLG